MTQQRPPKSVSVISEDGFVSVSRRTYRSADFTHIIFGALATVMGGLFLWLGITNGTLFNDVATPVVIGVLLGYGYFAVTRIVNRRTVVITHGHITAKDGPLPQFVRNLHERVEDYGEVEVRSATRLTFPIMQRYSIWYVGAEGQVDLFRRLHDEPEARYIEAVVSDALSDALEA